jgi:FMN-dependent NADH-azoreductase
LFKKNTLFGGVISGQLLMTNNFNQQKNYKRFMKILHIDCSIRDDRSVSKRLSGIFVSKLTAKFKHAEIDYLDLSRDTPKHPSALLISGNYTPEPERTAEMLKELEESEALVDRLINADIYVIGMPMYNFSVPSNFKVFIDNIVRINRTFKLTPTGSEGLLTGKKAYVINTRGVDFNNEYMQQMDQLKPYLKTVFGFMGLTDITFIDVSPVQFSAEEERRAAIENAELSIASTIDSL